jgi:hypothetical protein
LSNNLCKPTDHVRLILPCDTHCQ